MDLTASELAAKLGVSKGRVSQYVSAGKLDGCFRGDGRDRRFDLAAVAAALGKRLDPGQMLGNGAATRKALRDLEADEDDAAVPPPPSRRSDGPLPAQDPGRYELARIQTAEENLRRIRRTNELDDGTLVLAAEVDRQVARAMMKEIGQFEAVLRDGARTIADRLGVDFKVARQILLDTWRKHRSDRADALAEEAAVAEMTDDERAADI